MAGGGRGRPAQVPVAFEDVAVYFSPGEWAQLEEWQQELHHDVMADSYELFASLECLLSIPELLSRLARGEGPCVVETPQPAEGRDPPAAAAAAPAGAAEDGGPSEEAAQPLEASSEEAAATRKKARLHPPRPAGGTPRRRPVSRDKQRTVISGSGPGAGACSRQPQPRERRFQCPKCQRRFLGRLALRAHRRLHARKWARVRPPGLGRGSPTPDLAGPPEGQLGASASPFPCGQGEGPLPFWPEMALHQQAPAAHGFNPWALGFGPQPLAGPQAPGLHGSGEFICDQCGWSFHGWEELVTHQMAHMAAEGIAGSVPKAGALAQLAADRPYSCNQCGKSFRHKPNLLAHRQVHTGERRYQCQECGKSFGSKAYLASHQHIHTGEKPYVCGQCGKSFRHKPNLISHQKIHSREPLPPGHPLDAFNGEAFPGAHPLADPLGPEAFQPARGPLAGAGVGAVGAAHLPGGPGDSPLPPLPGLLGPVLPPLAGAVDRPFVCPVCTKPFRCKPYLVAHLRIHTGEKPYACSRCPKRFSQKSNLVSHERLHTGEKPYACPLCPRVFSQGSNMRAHQRSHRNVGPVEAQAALRQAYPLPGHTQPPLPN